MDLWIVPAAPLMLGRGWRIWCSHKGEGSFSPSQFEVRHHHATVPSQSEWTLFSRIPG